MGDFRLLAGQRAKEGHDFVNLCLGQFGAQLRGGHDRDRLGQIPDHARVEIGRRQRDIAQRRGAEHIFVVHRLRHLEPTTVAFGQDRAARPLDQTEGEIILSADVNPGMAGHAAGIDEGRQPALFLIGHGIVIAVQEQVKGTVGGNQRGLICLDGDGEIVEADRIVLTGEGGFERLDIAGHGLQRLDQVLGGVVHLDRGLKRPLGLFGQIARPTIPELGDVEDGVVHGGRVARPLLPAMPDRDLQPVCAADADIVAGLAGEQPRARHARIEKQHRAQIDPFGRQLVAFGGDGFLRDRFEIEPGIFAQCGIVYDLVLRECGQGGDRQCDHRGNSWLHGLLLSATRVPKGG